MSVKVEVVEGLSFLGAVEGDGGKKCVETPK
jgi:hypothetical protein